MREFCQILTKPEPSTIRYLGSSSYGYEFSAYVYDVSTSLGSLKAYLVECNGSRCLLIGPNSLEDFENFTSFKVNETDSVEPYELEDLYYTWICELQSPTEIENMILPLVHPSLADHCAASWFRLDASRDTVFSALVASEEPLALNPFESYESTGGNFHGYMYYEFTGQTAHWIGLINTDTGGFAMQIPADLSLLDTITGPRSSVPMTISMFDQVVPLYQMTAHPVLFEISRLRRLDLSNRIQALSFLTLKR